MLRNTALAGTSTLNLVLGVSLCTIGGAMLYVYFKQQDEEESEKGKKKTSTKKTKEQKEIKAQLVVSNEHVPLILGRNGANLMLIEEKSRTKIYFRDKNDTQKFCEISGLRDDVRQAHMLLMKEMERSPIVKEEIFLPQTVCGRIIGYCGESLQEISRASHAKVCLDAGGSRVAGTDKRRITVTGNRSQVNLALKLLEQKIDADAEVQHDMEEVEHRREPRRSPTSSLYSSQNSLSPSMAPRDKVLSAQGEEKTCEVFVSAVASPSKFWVQLVGPHMQKLDDMVTEMTQYYEDPENREQHIIKEPYLGQIVAAVFKFDGKWYRAEIVGILPNDYNPKEVVLDLYFVDYGDSGYVAPHEVYELRTDFLTLRFQAVECFLANIKSSNVKNPDTWETQAVEKFEELTHVANWKKLISRVVTYRDRRKDFTSANNNINTENSASREGSPIPGVELFEVIDDVEVNIGHMLISHGYALPTDANKSSIFSSLQVLDSPRSNVSSHSFAPTECSYSSFKTAESNSSPRNNIEGASDAALDTHLDAQIQHLRKNNVNNNFENPKDDLYFKNTNGDLLTNGLSHVHVGDKHNGFDSNR